MISFRWFSLWGAFQVLIVVSRVGSEWSDRGLEMVPVELDALIGFKEAMVDHMGLMESWNMSTHPCTWQGVLCNCQDTFPASAREDCPDAGYLPGADHVFGLDFGTWKPASSKLFGNLTEGLGNLSEARMFFFLINHLRGTIPSALGKLGKLNRMVLRNNQLTGTLPSQLGETRLKSLLVDSNQLTGNLPVEWCKLVVRAGGSLATMAVANNPGLCGMIPECFQWDPSVLEPQNVAGTCLDFPPPASRPGFGGACDSSPPTCAHPASCIDAPKLISNLSTCVFTIHDFVDEDSGIREYRWFLGNSPGLANAIPSQIVSMGNSTIFDTFRIEIGEQQNLLPNGLDYYISVEAVNGACPELTTTISSGAIRLDRSPPEPHSVDGHNGIFTNINCDRFEGHMHSGDLLGVCWYFFDEKETEVTFYELAVLRIFPSGEVDTVANFSSSGISCHPAILQCKASRDIDLQSGATYSVLVKAHNSLNISGVGESLLLRIGLSHSDKVPLVEWMSLLLVAALSLLMAGSIFYVLYQRARTRALQAESARRQEMEDAQALLRRTIVHTFGPKAGWAAHYPKLGLPCLHCNLHSQDWAEVAFVFTDIEESTRMSNADPRLYAEMQEIHDQVIREQTTLHNGYEVNTQGDSFEIVFQSVELAVRFCLVAQMRLLQTNWDPEICKRLPTCAQVVDSEGRLLFHGPRVRMGIHFADKSTFRTMLHTQTKHVQFAGTSHRLAMEVGDCANGGQIVMSQQALESFYVDDENRCIGLIRHLGLFQFNVNNSQVILYEVSYPLTISLPIRRFPPIQRNCIRLQEGSDLNISHLDPQFNSEVQPLHLSYVILKTSQFLCEEESEALMTTLASSAQLFQGFYNSHLPTCFAFSTPALAIRFAIVVQIALFARSQPNCSGDKQDTQNNFTLKGLGIGALVHTGSVPCGASCSDDREGHLEDIDWDMYGEEPLLRDEHFGAPAVSWDLSVNSKSDMRIISRKQMNASMEPGQDKKDVPVSVAFSGQEFKFALKMSKYVYEGQVVITENVWKNVNEALPRLTQVVSLGIHVLRGLNRPQTLFELSRHGVPGGEFPPVASLRCLSPGYRQAPSARVNMAIMYCKFKTYSLSEMSLDNLSLRDTSEEKLGEVYSEALRQTSRLVRKLLHQFEGYECKQQEAEKFMLAFITMNEAVAFAVTLQVQLLHIEWNPALLQFPPHKQVFCSDTERLIKCGLSCAIGAAWGKPTHKKLSHAGRADYDGAIPRLAARLAGTAALGQVILESTNLCQLLSIPKSNLQYKGDFADYERESQKFESPRVQPSLPSMNLFALFQNHAVAPLSNFRLHEMNYEASWFCEIPFLEGTGIGPIKLKGLGLIWVKGIEDPVPLTQAWLPDLDSREFPPPRNEIFPSLVSFTGSYVNRQGGDNRDSWLVVRRKNSESIGLLSNEFVP
eukprot:CAMPEP_0196577262 /NCGR_PEP_ID=MMETSP1081-20130531/6347_1 /TAXON_ID=36882 /ORGANISM="Pyramimonas amylifera, Strain CCMP720" /LENGTH=1426 /DNA_ID=CAMNT_0041896137 /DNA_START=359 /DNA_END=4639 /DNA_ORIENTATION=-